MSYYRIILNSHQQLKENFFHFFLITLCTLSLSYGFLVFIPDLGELFWLFFFLPVLTVGIIRFSYQVTQGEKPKFTDMFSRFYDFPRILTVSFLTYIGITLGLMLFILPALVLSCAFWMSNILLVLDPSSSPVRILKKSALLMQGYKLKAVILLLCLVPFLLLIPLTYGLAVFYVSPLLYLTYCNFYCELIQLECKEDCD